MDSGKSKEGKAPQQISQQQSSPQKQKNPIIRKIPETLVQSYDLVTIKEERKKRFKPQKTQQMEKDYLKQVAAKLRPVYGTCTCWYNGDVQRCETAYQLSAASLILSKVDIINLKNITKIKLKKVEDQKTYQRIVKISWVQQLNPQLVIFLQFKKPEQAYFLFSAVITRRMMINQFLINDISTQYRQDFTDGITKIQGEIIKMSNYLKNWERRKIIINQNSQLQSYKDNKCTFTIKTINQLWTRFSMKQGFLIIKVHQGKQKNQIGIPVIDYTNIASHRNWLFSFAKMLK